MRAGVRMPPLKAMIFDAIKAAGDVGINSQELLGRVFEGRRPLRENTIKAHVWQLNDLLEATRFIIVSDRRRWTIARRKVRAIA